LPETVQDELDAARDELDALREEVTNLQAELEDASFASDCWTWLCEDIRKLKVEAGPAKALQAALVNEQNPQDQVAALLAFITTVA
jgi:hypothetical protein